MTEHSKPYQYPENLIRMKKEIEERFGNDEERQKLPYEKWRECELYYLKPYRDLKNAIDTAREEGRAIGLKEGRAKAIEKGKAEGLKKSARNLLNIGASIETIQAVTGLSKEEIGEIE
ncbi:MAG: hypothetical protein ACK5LR_02925 [Mangrovibacterium sp.]